MATISSRSLNLGDREIPVVLPNRRDPRLHTAAVIVSIHVLGITTLGFRVSVPQILSAILAAAAVDVLMTLRNTGKLVWPASGMLTGSGVALILRLTGMESGEYWSWTGWHYYALVGGVSLITKYVIRYGGSHVFNPSNVGLVAAFLLLGSTVVEPLDFWWAPMGVAMAAGYLIIVLGGVLITLRLKLLEMAVAYWVVLAAGLGILAVSGHCMTAAWSIDPVCGSRFWIVLITSPEVLIFMFFMITDPRTVPTGRFARLAFAMTLGGLTTLLIAPHTVEFGTKVALLGSLVLCSPLRGLFDRLLPDSSPDRAGVLSLLERSVGTGRKTIKVFANGVLVGCLLVILTVAIVVSGAPARTPTGPASGVAGPQLVADIDPVSIPEVSVDPGVRSLNLDADADFARDLGVTLAENLWFEGEAIRRGDGSLLGAADGAERLVEMQARIDEALATGARVVHEYVFESLMMSVADNGGEQLGAALALSGTGTVDEVTYDALGVEQSRTESTFASTFVMRQLGGERWVLVDVEDGASS